MTIVLARKYRPQFFRDVIGQDIFVRMIRNALKQGRVGHGFLLTGIRGIGKTTLARLMAKALTCSHLQDDQEPCGICPSCQAIVQEKHLDIMEIDAASHTGIDDIRQILEGCSYRAVMGAFKIFIIDEVHMLSKSAFNALLKTLEEPPAHVKFILATTEVSKVPLTVVSRCQQIHLKRVTPEILIPHLHKICTQEGFEKEEEALALLARYSDGGVRDALSFLERALLIAEDKIVSLAVIQSLLGLPSDEEIQTLLEAIATHKPEIILQHARSFYHSGLEPQTLLSELLSAIHGKIVSYFILHHSEKDRKLSFPSLSLKEEGSSSGMTNRQTSFPPSYWDRLWQIARKGWIEVIDAPFPLLSLEITLLRMAYMGQFPSPEDVLSMIEPLQESHSTSSSLQGKNSFSDKKSPKPQLSSYSESSRPSSSLQEGGQSFQNSSSPVTYNKPLASQEVKEALNSSALSSVKDLSKPLSSLNPLSFNSLLQAVKEQREGILYTYLTTHIAFVAWHEKSLELSWVDSSPLPPSLTSQLEAFLKEWSSYPYQVLWSDRPQGITFQAQQEVCYEKTKNHILEHPLLIQAKKLFPDFTLEEISQL